MGRILDTALVDALGTAGRRTILKVTLGDGVTDLFFSTGDTLIDGVLYLGKLASVDDLNLDATQASEGINLKISDITLSLGQNLINTPDVLTGTKAILGVYFYDGGGSWTDEKLEGKLTVGEIDGDWINIMFESTVSSKIWNGVTIASLFSAALVPAEDLPTSPVTPVTPPLPIYNDLHNLPRDASFALARNMSPLLDDFQYAGRNYLPSELLDF